MVEYLRPYTIRWVWQARTINACVSWISCLSD
jgi:hypothetical protein